MKFLSSRELRINPGAVWKRLRKEQDLVITSSGKPVGILTFADEDSLEETLTILRQGRAQAAAAHLRHAAVERGLDAMSDETIQEVVKKTRRSKRQVASRDKVEDRPRY